VGIHTRSLASMSRELANRQSWNRGRYICSYQCEYHNEGTFWCSGEDTGL
jgi:hypothetical protein